MAQIVLTGHESVLSCLRGSLMAGSVVMMLVDAWEHWVVAVGTLGKRILVVDPGDNELVISYTGEDLLSRWMYNGACNGILISRRGK